MRTAGNHPVNGVLRGETAGCGRAAGKRGDHGADRLLAYDAAVYGDKKAGSEAAFGGLHGGQEAGAVLYAGDGDRCGLSEAESFQA